MNSAEKMVVSLFFTFQRKFVFLPLSNAKSDNSSCVRGGFKTSLFTSAKVVIICSL